MAPTVFSATAMPPWVRGLAPEAGGEFGDPVGAVCRLHAAGTLELAHAVQCAPQHLGGRPDVAVAEYRGQCVEAGAQFARLTQLSYYPELMQRVQALHEQGLNAAGIAAALDAEGFRPPKRIPRFTRDADQRLLPRVRVTACTPPRPGTGPGGLARSR
jgi:hypothetical protein